MSNPKAIPFANIPYLRVWDRLPLNSFAISLLLLLTFVAIALLQDLMLGTDDRASIGDGDDVTPGQQMLLLSGFLFTYLVGYFLFLWVRGFVGDIQRNRKQPPVKKIELNKLVTSQKIPKAIQQAETLNHL